LDTLKEIAENFSSLERKAENTLYLQISEDDNAQGNSNVAIEIKTH